MEHMKRVAPAILLFFLSPAVAELLSASAPPSEFFQPVGFVIITCLYGSGALLVRELTTRWHKGWPTLFTLGAAYGIIEEGLMVKSFFDPNWMDIGILGSYGRWLGVNWVWSLELTIYHSVVSLAVPIVIVGLIFPERRQQAWLGGSGLIICSALLAADVIFGFLFMTPYRPPAVPYIFAIIAVAGLVLLSWRLPQHPFRPITVNPRRPLWFWVVGFMSMVLFFVVFGGLPNTAIPAAATMLIGLALVALAAWLIMKMSGNGHSWTGRHQVALVSGILSFFILLSPIREFGSQSTDNPTGMTIVGLVTLILLVLLWWRVHRREKATSRQSASR